MYTFSAIPVKLPVAFSETLNKIFQSVWRHKRPQIAKEILRKESGAGGFIVFRQYNRATVVKAV